MLLTREQLTKPATLNIEKVVNDAGHVFVREMGVEEYVCFQDEHKDGAAPAMFMSRLLVSTVCDEKGVLILKPEDVQKLAKTGAALAARVFEAALRLNGLSAAEDKEQAGNLPAASGGASPSA